jgi:hypothetical protein
VKLSELAYQVEWPHGLVIDDADIEIQAMNAARHYLGWGVIRALLPVAPAPSVPDGRPVYSGLDGDAIIGWYGGIYGGTPASCPAPVDPGPPLPLTFDTDLTDGEWALIRPLYMLYIEKVNAVALEASRTLGVEVYGRAVSEIQQDIEREEKEHMPRMAFSCDVVTI